MSATQGPSFRDPQGRLFFCGNQVFRALNPEGELSFHRLQSSAAFQSLFASGSIVPTRILQPDQRQALLSDAEAGPVLRDMDCRALLEHEPAPFPNYAHEWPPEMLHAAGELTIQLALDLLPDGLGLKDATPSNVMFWGAKPVFLDLPSFEKRNPHDPTWLPYAQFVRTFLLPLTVNRRFGIPLSQIFTTRRDGLEPEEVYPLLGTLERFHPRSLSLISLPVWFSKRGEDQKLYQPRMLKNPEQAQFILQSLLRRQHRLLRRLRPLENRQSTWSDYTSQGHNNYSSEQADAKTTLVRQFLSDIRPGAVLDVGCNTGVFSRMAAEAGARVVAIDYDPVVIGTLWRNAAKTKLPILPLVVNLAQPTPALGWMNRECRSFVDRATGAFDAVLMLAVLHHLIVTERVPLPEVFETVRRITRRWLILEFVAPSDSMFVRLTRGRAHLHQDLTRESFEAAAQRHFRIVRSEQIPGADRRLYLMEATA